MSKKPDTKKVTTSVIPKPVTKTVTGVVDTVYNDILDRAVASYRNVQGASLLWAWELGDLFTDFKSKVEAKSPERTTLIFIQDLRTRGVTEIAESSLYFSQRLRKSYDKPALLELAKTGAGTGIVKQLMALDGNPVLKEKVLDNLITADGRMMTNEELSKFIAENARPAAMADFDQKTADTPTPSKAKDAEPYVWDESLDDPDSVVGGAKPETPGVDPKAAAPKDNADGRAGSVGAARMPDFTVNVPKVLKAADNACTKLIATFADLIIAATQVTKVGYDGDQAKKNAQKNLSMVHGGLKDIERALPEVIARVREALDDVGG